MLLNNCCFVHDCTHRLMKQISSRIPLFNVCPFTCIQHRNVYWPPPSNKRSRLIQLPSGKKMFVFNIKRDEDGELEPALVFLDPGFKKRCYFIEEEVDQFIQLIPRLRSYFDLWDLKAQNAHRLSLNDLKRSRTTHPTLSSFQD